MVDDEWELIEPAHIDFWTQDSLLIARRSFLHNGCEIFVTIDWRPIGRRYKQHFDLLQPVRRGKATNDNWYRKVFRPVRLKAKVRIEGKNEVSGYAWYPGFFLEMAIYEAFAIANLALPGCAEFYTLSIQGGSQNQTLEPKLSAFGFDFWWVESIRGHWPTLRCIPLNRVVQWFDALSTGHKQKADTGTERALFVLYHLCKLDDGIESVIWLFHGLEAVLGTRVGENLSGLLRRISMLLDPSPKQLAYLKKRLKELYDLRSAFVHGGYGVTHPIHSEVVDRRLDDDVEKLMSANAFGFGLLVAVLQAMICNDLLELTFEEKLIGKQLSPKSHGAGELRDIAAQLT